MALINCPECGKQISDRSKSCIHCGYPLEAPLEPPPTPAAPMVDGEIVPQKSAFPPTPEEKKKTIIKFTAILAVCVLIIILICILANPTCKADNCNNTPLTNGDYCATHTCIETGCYNRTASGSVFCYTHGSSYSAAAANTTSNTPTHSYENAETVLEISDVKIEHNSLYTVCTGTMTNDGSRTYKFVKVKGAFQTSGGSTIDTDSTYAVGSEGLAPGESTTFRMSVDKDSTITKCDVTVYDYDYD